MYSVICKINSICCYPSDYEFDEQEGVKNRALLAKSQWFINQHPLGIVRFESF